MVRVIGVDPSISSTGFIGELDWLSIGGPADMGDLRLEVIHDTIVEMLVADDSGPYDLAVVEDLPKHAMAAGITGMAQGVVRLALMQSRVPYAKVVPSTLKKYATGTGNATKADMRMALYKRMGLDENNEDMVDAYWLRAMGLDHLGSPLFTLPATHRIALEKVTWPK